MFKFLRKTFLYILAIPVLSMVLGAASNQLVLIANHNTFPVMLNAAKLDKYSNQHGTYTLPDGTVLLDYTHSVMTSKSHLNFLADIIDEGTDGTLSVGDLALELGQWMWTFAPYAWALAVISKLNKQE